MFKPIVASLVMLWTIIICGYNIDNGYTEQIKIAGIVIDKETGERLPGVVIRTNNTDTPVYTNLEGYFELLEPIQDSYTLNVSYTSYKEIVKIITVPDTTIIIPITNYIIK